jgi:hypothetical protein
MDSFAKNVTEAESWGSQGFKMRQ